jgi:hypothetical protein
MGHGPDAPPALPHARDARVVHLDILARRDPVVVQVEHDREHVAERQHVVEAVGDLVILHRQQALGVVGEAGEARAEGLDARRAGAAMDVDVRPPPVPPAGQPEQAHQRGVVLELVHRAAEHLLPLGGQHAVLAGMGGEADIAGLRLRADRREEGLDHLPDRGLVVERAGVGVGEAGEGVARDAHGALAGRAAPPSAPPGGGARRRCGAAAHAASRRAAPAAGASAPRRWCRGS